MLYKTIFIGKNEQIRPVSKLKQLGGGGGVRKLVQKNYPPHIPLMTKKKTVKRECQKKSRFSKQNNNFAPVRFPALLSCYLA